MIAEIPESKMMLVQSPFKFKPDKALFVRLFYHYTDPLTTYVVPKNSEGFTLEHHPNIWYIGLDYKSGYVTKSIENISYEENGASKLVLVLVVCFLQCNLKRNLLFWEYVQSVAFKSLFEFVDAPQQFFGCIDNLPEFPPGILRVLFPAPNGKKFFAFESGSYGGLFPIEFDHGMSNLREGIAKLPVLTFTLV